ncbi:MAG TPA: beta-ketoacyl synthase N-terminal-like domain-containing protein [Thermoanaerobaculia bacterium]|jgi:3-oxoacyl-[acyl-carrier-protein] synthase II|nr:beta-ketoacyl synthase N-terminal-like domain-containing protein [Thermoanaerobaculia bacterium]
MRRVVVTGAGAVSSLATSAAGLHEALKEGRSGLKPVELFPLNGLGPRLAGEVRPFEPKEWLGEKNLRPVDRTARLLLVAAHQALEAGGWTPEMRTREQAGLVLGTMYCSVRTIAEFDRRAVQAGPSHASPLDFANSVINAAAGQAAIWHGLPGVNSTISAGAASGLLALSTAADLIRTGRSGALLAGGVEELCYESFVAFLRAGYLAESDVSPVPFDRWRDGMALAEGAALLALEEAGEAERRGAPVLAEILGHGTAFDPTGGEQAADTLARAVRLALDDAGLGPGEIDAVSAGANGRVEEDRQEAAGLAAALGERASTVPVTAIKSMLGEALGASGALQAVAALGTLSDGVLPGIPGLGEVEEGFALGGVSAVSRPVRARRILITSGYGGHNCALILGAAQS